MRRPCFRPDGSRTCGCESLSMRPGRPQRSSEVDLGLEVASGIGVRERLFERDAAVLVQFVQGGIEAADAAVAAAHDRLLDSSHIPAPHELGDMRRVEHDLDRRQALAVDARDEPLREDGAPVLRQVERDLLVLFERKHIDGFGVLRTTPAAARGLPWTPVTSRCARMARWYCDRSSVTCLC